MASVTPNDGEVAYLRGADNVSRAVCDLKARNDIKTNGEAIEELPKKFLEKTTSYYDKNTVDDNKVENVGKPVYFGNKVIHNNDLFTHKILPETADGNYSVGMANIPYTEGYFSNIYTDTLCKLNGIPYSFDDVEGVLSVEKGGTGANSVDGAKTNLGIDKVETTLNEHNKKINILRAIHDINVSDVKILPGSRIELTNMLGSGFTDKITVYECDKDITAGSGANTLTSDNYVLYLRRKKGVYTMPKIDFSQMQYTGLKNVVWVVENIDFSPPIIHDTYFEENANIRIVARNCIVRMRSNGTNFRNLPSAATELDFDGCYITGYINNLGRAVAKSAKFNNCYFEQNITNIEDCYMTITNSCTSKSKFTTDDTLVNLMYNNKTEQTAQLI